MLLPMVAAGAAPELQGLRDACRTVVDRLAEARPDVTCIVGAGDSLHWYQAGDAGSFRRYGIALDVSLGPAAGRSPTLPLSLTVGAWLLHAAGCSGRLAALGVPAAASDAELAAAGRRLGDLAPRVSLLVMGDGSARRGAKAPGYIDDRAAAFDRAVAGALGSADSAALAGLAPDLGESLLAAGTAPWRLLGLAGDDSAWDAELLVDCAPYGVGYFVAGWRRR